MELLNECLEAAIDAVAGQARSTRLKHPLRIVRDREGSKDESPQVGQQVIVCALKFKSRPLEGIDERAKSLGVTLAWCKGVAPASSRQQIEQESVRLLGRH